MGGTSTQNQQTSQTQTGTNTQTTNPWAESMPFLSGILGQLNGQAGSTSLSPAENAAYNTRVANANGATSQFGPQVNGLVGGLLSGGGATSTNPMIEQAYQDYQHRLGATADGSMIGQNSGLQPYLDTLRNDITGQVNGSFAAAGRDLSGANQNALGRGIASGLAPVIAGQYNTDVSNMLGAASSLYGAGNTTAGLLAGNNAQANANKLTGAGLIPSVMDLQNSGANATLEAEAARRGIPLQTLGLLAQIGVPIAGLGGTTTGNFSGTATGNSSTRNQMSGAQQFATIAQGIQNLMPRAPMSFSF